MTQYVQKSKFIVHVDIRQVVFLVTTFSHIVCIADKLSPYTVAAALHH